MEVLQLWVNLPSKYKIAAPHYIGLQRIDVPEVNVNDGQVIVQLVSGAWGEVKAPIQPLSDVKLSCIELKASAQLDIGVPAQRTVLFYLVKGKVRVQNEGAEMHDLLEFNRDGEHIRIQVSEGALVLFGHAEPNKEPVVAHGSFVMNTQEEMRQAFVDYQQGQFGVWQDE